MDLQTCNKNYYVLASLETSIFSRDIHEDGSATLNEGTILRKNNVRFLINSNEQGSHHRPHIHVVFDNEGYDIAIDSSFDLLSKQSKRRVYNYIVKNYFTSNNIQLFRKSWNELTKSLLVFKIEDDVYTSNIAYRTRP